MMREDLTARLQAAINGAQEHRRARDLVKMLLDSAKLVPQLEAATDTEMAALCTEIANNIPMTDPMLDILDNVAARLRRAGGGGYRECTWCSKQATHEHVGEYDEPGCDEHQNGETP